MNQIPQPSSPERVNQSAIKYQSEQKSTLILDASCEMEYIEEISTLMTRINRTQFSDANQLRHFLKTQNSVYLNLLQIIVNAIDPFFEITSFTDEKFWLFLKGLGYPCKQISKTRFLSLGSSHTYLQSIHILSWLSKSANQLITMNERLEKGQYKSIEDANLSQGQKMKKLIAEYVSYGYTQQFSESELERFYKDAKQKLILEHMNVQNDIHKLQCEMNLVSTSEPNLEEAQEECNAKDSEVKLQMQEISNQEEELDKTMQDLNKTMNNSTQLDKEIEKLYEVIEAIREQIAQQKVSLEKAKQLEAQDRQHTIQNQSLLSQLEDIQKKIQTIREEKTQLLSKLANYSNLLNTNGVKVGREYELFEKVSLDSEQEKAIKIQEEESVMNSEKRDLQLMSNKKLASVRDLLISENGDAIQKFILPQKDQLNEDLDKKIEDSDQVLRGEQRTTQELRLKLMTHIKQQEEIECGKKLVQQEIAAISDSSSELMVMKQIFQEQEEKQTILLKEIELKKMEIEFLKQQQKLETIEIERLQKSMDDISEQINEIQVQAEATEERSSKMLQNFKEWVNQSLKDFQQFVDQND